MFFSFPFRCPELAFGGIEWRIRFRFPSAADFGAHLCVVRACRYTSGVFQYREHTGTNLLGGIILTFGTVVTFLALTLRVVRWAVKKMMPRGTGPSLKARESGFMRCKMVAVTDEPVPRKALLRITGSGDPGYKLTSQMVRVVCWMWEVLRRACLI